MIPRDKKRQKQLNTILETLNEIEKALDIAEVDFEPRLALYKLLIDARETQKQLQQANEELAVEQAASRGNHGLAAWMRAFLKTPATWIDISKLKSQLKDLLTSVEELLEHASEHEELAAAIENLKRAQTSVRNSIDHFSVMRTSAEEAGWKEHDASASSDAPLTSNLNRRTPQAGGTSSASAGLQGQYLSQGPPVPTKQRSFGSRLFGTRGAQPQSSLGRVPEDNIVQQPRGMIPEDYNNFGNPTNQHHAPPPPENTGYAGRSDGPWPTRNQVGPNPDFPQSGHRSFRATRGTGGFSPPEAFRSYAPTQGFGITSRGPSTFVGHGGFASPQVHQQPSDFQQSRHAFDTPERARERQHRRSSNDMLPREHVPQQVPPSLPAPPPRFVPIGGPDSVPQGFAPHPPQGSGRGHSRGLSNLSAFNRPPSSGSSGQSTLSGYNSGYEQSFVDNRPGTSASGDSRDSYDPNRSLAPYPPHPQEYYAQDNQSGHAHSTSSRRSSSSGGHRHG